MPLTDLNLHPVYNHGNCPDMLAGLYEPLLEQAVRYDRTTYTFTAKGLIAAATGTAALIRNGGRIRLICDHSVHEDVLQAIHDGQLDAETALQQTARREDLLLTETADIADRNHLELAYWLVANGIMEVKVAVRGDRIFHNKSGIVEDRPRQSGRLRRQPQRNPVRVASQLGVHPRIHRRSYRRPPGS